MWPDYSRQVSVNVSLPLKIILNLASLAKEDEGVGGEKRRVLGHAFITFEQGKAKKGNSEIGRHECQI